MFPHQQPTPEQQPTNNTYEQNPTTMLSLEKAVERKSKIAAFRMWLAKNGLDEKDHQISGMKFCVEHEITDTPSNGVRGAIIADEMGLGKTILMMGLNAVNPDKRTLIVLPPALMEQWINIIRNFMHINHQIFKIYKVDRLERIYRRIFWIRVYF